MATYSPHTGQSGGDDGDLPEEVVEDLLASEPRRRILTHLHARGSPVAVDDLAALVATGAPDGDVSAEERRRVRTEIYQDHLPKLTATEAVSFDSMLGTVEFTGGPALVARLEASEDASDRGTEDK